MIPVRRLNVNADVTEPLLPLPSDMAIAVGATVYTPPEVMATLEITPVLANTAVKTLSPKSVLLLAATAGAEENLVVFVI